MLEMDDSEPSTPELSVGRSGGADGSEFKLDWAETLHSVDDTSIKTSSNKSVPGSAVLGLGAALGKSWDVLENRKIELPWESDLWKTVFSNQPLTNLECNFVRPAAEPLPIVSLATSSNVESATSSRKKAKIQHWKFVIAEVDSKSWQEQLEAKRETALKGWFDILEGIQEGYPVILQFKALDG